MLGPGNPGSPEGVHRERVALTLEEMEQLGVFCVCFTALPVQVKQVVLYGGFLHLSKEKVKKLDVELYSPMIIPTLAMKLWWDKGKLQLGLHMELLPVE